MSLTVDEPIFSTKIPANATAPASSAKLKEALQMVRSGQLQIGSSDSEAVGIFNSDDVRTWDFSKEGALGRIQEAIEQRTGLKEIPPILLRNLGIIHQQALKKPASTMVASVAKMVSTDKDVMRAYNQKALAALCSS